MNNSLKAKKHLILSKIYCLRTMSFNQVYEFIFAPEDLTVGYCSEVMKKMTASGYIEKIGHYNEEAYYFLKKRGIDYLKSEGVINIGDRLPQPVSDFKTAGKLKIKETYIKHQLMLNQFVLEYERDTAEYFEYYDEINVSTLFTNVRPDGIIKKGNTYYFLETDMNTERSQRLQKKWESYRRFAISQDYLDMRGDVKILFILERVNEYSKRIINLEDYIYNNMNDIICSRLDVLINPRARIIKAINDNEIQSKVKSAFERCGYEVTKESFKVESLLDNEFMTYAYKPTNQGRITIENNEHLEFLIDDFTNNSCYVIKKIRSYNALSSMFSVKNKRTIKYILVIAAEEHSYLISKRMSNFNNDIIFTTPERLKYSESIYNALFQVTSTGTIYHFSENNLKVPVLEYTIPTKFLKIK